MGTTATLPSRFWHVNPCGCTALGGAHSRRGNPPKYGAPAARLFAPTADADKLILQRHQEAQLSPTGIR
jgi:hypothetical protein